jgi:heat shock protein HslJ
VNEARGRAGRMIAALGALLAALALTACSGDDEATASDSAAVEGVPWVLASGIDAGAPAPSASFADGTMSGSTGCNRYTAPYEVDGGSLRIGRVATTGMACPPPADAVEREFLAALERVTGWRADDGELALLGDGAPALRFRAATPAGSWTVTSLIHGDALASPVPGTSITATFADDGTVSGSAGCNRYTATYTTTGHGIAVTAPASTRMACPEPEGVMEQEASYLAGLPEAARFRVEGRALELLRADGTFVATFAPG